MENQETKTIKTAIVGCGRICVMHFDGIARSPLAQLVACCDVDEKKANDAAKKYGCTPYTDYREMIDKENLDAIHICLPHYLHAPVAQYALKKGLHVLCEKPQAITLADAERTVEIAKEQNLCYSVILQCRYNASSAFVKQAIKSGRLGKILCASSVLTWSRSDDYYSQSDWKGTWDKEGGGVVIDQAIHSIDLVNWIVDSPVEKVSVSMANRGHEKVKVEDTADGMITYKNGVRYCFWCTNDFATDEPIQIKIVCEKGTATFSYDDAEIVYSDGTSERAENDDFVETVEGGKDYWGFRHAEQIKRFYEAIAGKRPLEISGEEVLSTQRLICAIYEEGKKHFTA